MARNKWTVTLEKKLPSAARYSNAIKSEIRNRLKEVGKQHVKSRAKVVSNWSPKTKPVFSSKVVVGRRISLRVGIREKGKPYWRWVDQGTRAHKIRAKNVPNLVFRRGGVPKTKAGPARFGAGRPARGPWVMKPSVNHPGTKARRFSRKINKDLKKDELAAIRNGLRAGLRKVRT